MKRKKKQDISLELVFAAVSMLALFFIMFGIIASDPAAEQVIQPDAMLARVVEDGRITDQEYHLLRQMTCQDIKMMLGTGKDVCIYFKDRDGNIVDISSDGSYGFGCPGLEIEGRKICNS